MSITWQGVFPAVTTPFREDESLDIEMFTLNLRAQLAAGVHGLVIGGTLGEASVLTDGDKSQLVEAAQSVASGRVPLILNIAEASLREALQKVKQAERWKVDGLMLLPPMRYRSDSRETLHWYQTICSSTGLPVMIYNNPVDYGTGVSLDMFEVLQALPNIQAVKESTRDVTNVTRMRNRFGDRFAILCGVDTLAMEELCLGADGWVAGLVCAFPEETVILYRLVTEGRLEEARNLYGWFMPLLELDIHSKLVQYIKLASQETGIGTEWVRAPRLTLTGEERARVLSVIRKAISSKKIKHV